MFNLFKRSEPRYTISSSLPASLDEHLHNRVMVNALANRTFTRAEAYALIEQGLRTHTRLNPAHFDRKISQLWSFWTRRGVIING